jgi:Resolvase, N terminal domain
VVMATGIKQNFNRHAEEPGRFPGSAPRCISQVAAVCRKVWGVTLPDSVDRRASLTALRNPDFTDLIASPLNSTKCDMIASVRTQRRNSLVIRKGTNLSKRSKALRAAQQVRISTDDQRYSIQNQAAAIATFAQQNNLIIVRTPHQGTASPHRTDRRCQFGVADFDHILVYDVSRWGRFQDRRIQ